VAAGGVPGSVTAGINGIGNGVAAGAPSPVSGVVISPAGGGGGGIGVVVSGAGGIGAVSAIGKL